MIMVVGIQWYCDATLSLPIRPLRLVKSSQQLLPPHPRRDLWIDSPTLLSVSLSCSVCQYSHLGVDNQNIVAHLGSPVYTGTSTNIRCLGFIAKTWWQHCCSEYTLWFEMAMNIIYTTHCCNERYVHCNTCLWEHTCLKWLHHLIKYWRMLLNHAKRNPGLTLNPNSKFSSSDGPLYCKGQSTILYFLQSHRVIWLVDVSFS